MVGSIRRVKSATYEVLSESLRKSDAVQGYRHITLLTVMGPRHCIKGCMKYANLSVNTFAIDVEDSAFLFLNYTADLSVFPFLLFFFFNLKVLHFCEKSSLIQWLSV